MRRHSLQDGTGIIADDGQNNATLVAGVTVPTDGSKGFAVGCFFLDLDSTTAGAQVYVNEGTAASCAFKPLPSFGSGRIVAAGAASLTVTAALHSGKTILLDQATGTAVTLPAFTGSGARYRFCVTVTKSGGSDVLTATGAYLFGGVFLNTDTTAGNLFTAVAAANAAGSTTFTMDGTTKGGRKGDWVEIEDVGTNVGFVRGSLNGSGTEDTPFA